MKLWVRSSINIQNLANMFNLVKGVFELSSSGSTAPGWLWFHPDPNISLQSPHRNNEVRQLLLYNEKNVHFDLLIKRPKSSSVSTATFITSFASTSNTSLTSHIASSVSNIRQGRVEAQKRLINEVSSEPQKAPPKKRGRSPGSKNKPKVNPGQEIPSAPAGIICKCNTTGWNCYQCRKPNCDFCSDNAEDGHKRICRRH